MVESSEDPDNHHYSPARKGNTFCGHHIRTELLRREDEDQCIQGPVTSRHRPHVDLQDGILLCKGQ